MFKYQPVCLVALALLCMPRTALQNNETGKVVFVNVLHRHGDRTLNSFYPTDPYQNLSYWPWGLGQLTNRGKKQLFELGQWLRRRYDILLTESYSPDVIYIQSTDMDRTLMSAECNLAGMFPPSGVQVWSDNLAWQPIPVHTTPRKVDKVLSPPSVPCPAYIEERQRVFTSDEKIQQLNETFSDLLRWTNENSGGNYTLLTINQVYDTLFVENSNNLTLPNWTDSVFPEPMREATVTHFMISTWTPTLARFMSGLLLQDMIQNMVDKLQNKTTRNVHVYSAHDNTITNLLNALGAFNRIIPPYAACFIMELIVDASGNHSVSLFYRNSTTDGPYLLTMPGCSPICPLDQFIAITQPLIPEDWDEECRIANGHQNSYLSIVLIVVAVAIVIIL